MLDGRESVTVEGDGGRVVVGQIGMAAIGRIETYNGGGAGNGVVFPRWWDCARLTLLIGLERAKLRPGAK